jgi:hypothetical protein
VVDGRGNIRWEVGGSFGRERGVAVVRANDHNHIQEPPRDAAALLSLQAAGDRRRRGWMGCRRAESHVSGRHDEGHGHEGHVKERGRVCACRWACNFRRQTWQMEDSKRQGAGRVQGAAA